MNPSRPTRKTALLDLSTPVVGSDAAPNTQERVAPLPLKRSSPEASVAQNQPNTSPPATPDQPQPEQDQPPTGGQPTTSSVVTLEAHTTESSKPTAEVVNPQPSEARVDPYIGIVIDGRYKLESVLGEGGMGVVYGGRHKIINKRVAIKILRTAMSRDREMTDRFLQEAQAASSIGHPHIVDVSDFGQLPDGPAYFVMEFLEGRSLAQELREKKPLPLARLTHIAKQVADALSAAHSQQIVHRDLKPDNIFLIKRGLEKDFVKILDFGIAKVATASTTKLTRAGTVFGTPHYMSPEQAAGAPVDHRTDIYSLGIIMYEMASGQLPFDADNFMGILTQHMYKAPVPIRALVPALNNSSPGLEAIILKTLSKKPEQRYASMQELIDDLNQLESGAMPLAVSELIARSGAFNVPVDYFKTGANPMPDVVPGTPPSQRLRWGLYAGLISIGAALSIVTAIILFGWHSSAQSTSPSPVASLITSPATPSTAVSSAAGSHPEAVSPPAPPALPGKRVLLLAVPLDSQVFAGDVSLGKAPVTLTVPSGEKLRIEVRHEGFMPSAVVVDGSHERQEVRLEKAPVPKGSNNNSPPPATNRHHSGNGDIIDPWGGRLEGV